MHKLYEKLVKNGEVTEIDILTELNENNVKKDKAVIAQKLVSNFKKDSIYNRIKKSEKVLCEVPFSLKINKDEKEFNNLVEMKESSQALVSGIIDLVFKEDDGWVILDYKTNVMDKKEDLETLKKYYSNQLKLYSVAFEKISGEKVKSRVLCFVRGMNDAGSGIEIVEVC